MSTSKVRTVCGSSARTDLCGGRSERSSLPRLKTGNRQKATGNRKEAQAFGFAFGAMVLALGVCAQAQKVPRIAYLTALSISTDASRIEALRQGLRDLGYVDGKNIIVEIRSTGGTSDGLAALARTRADQSRYHRNWRSHSNPPRERSNFYHSDRDGAGQRSRR